MASEPAEHSRPPAYEYRHAVSFEETNFVGNVYYVNPIRWQGRCREMFLRDHCPDVIADLARDLRMVTLRCSCEYLAELGPADEVIVRMRLAEQVQNRIVLAFDYVRAGATRDDLVARGEQEVACMKQTDAGLEPTPVPGSLSAALDPYRVA